MDAQEKTLYIAIILAVVIVSLITFAFFYAILKQHKKLLRLERESSRAQVELLEKDRARIAEDLHDDLAPMLAVVRMKVNCMELADDNSRKLLLVTNETIDDIARRMRSISFDLMPASLQEKGLEKAVLELINHVGSASPLHIRFLRPGAALSLSETTTIHLYRVIQEIIHNTIKHAKATELIIVLRKENDYLVLASEDNGIGFEYSSAKKGLGLKSLQNRASLLNGELIINTAPGKGTAITIEMPLRNE